MAEAQEFDFIILSGDIISLNAEEVILELVIFRAGLGGWLIVSDSPLARAGVCGGGGGGHHKQRHFLSRIDSEQGSPALIPTRACISIPSSRIVLLCRSYTFLATTTTHLSSLRLTSAPALRSSGNVTAFLLLLQYYVCVCWRLIRQLLASSRNIHASRCVALHFPVFHHPF